MAKTVLNVRIEESEMEILKQYCQQSGRTQTDVVRELVRGLRRKLSGSTDK
jgi:hypothetical protein